MIMKIYIWLWKKKLTWKTSYVLDFSVLNTRFTAQSLSADISFGKE